ncbi:MAG: 3-hydroxyacyl-ACP dehydratase FabZ [Roseibium sp.]|uniref:3-hydroxyacyl-ACP dehydratase FabZ n=1 Tax=Roseibium sp. TaxID=1936156 RepID=UPI001B133E93|nr:3-hydroxyacyl-ACP dehydratase FabZ [Roseibium sp.]MBO6511326.1 3-hydroxyacyl-ACP dehydratase FabZ [Roseibium sp.]MBO6892989.1 3-hydroxyacyl-ACP dehydratase FabZ [Roseibium sp.]MBO6929432.1 3-hydroxyacyl-ACP dehydratase FabZ [Roseibium sp.]
MEDAENKTLASADIMEIMKLLPHRYPFLMIDKIIEMDGDNSCIGIKNVTINEPHFTGHFPERPVFPGVLLIEAMAQTAGALCVHARGSDGPPQLVYFMTIDKAKFRKPVEPGDQVHFHVKKIKQRSNIWKFDAVAKVNDQKVAEAEVSAMLVDA